VPLYDYQCRSCNKVTEVRHGFKEEHTDACPACGGELARVFNPAGIVFKGSGFYVTDSRKGGESKSEGKSETKTESKPESSPPKTESAA
jgi:putative FmdB family regulatory protein